MIPTAIPRKMSRTRGVMPSLPAYPAWTRANPQEAKDMTVFAFELSEKFNIPVMLRPTTRVSHARADVEIGPAKAPCEQCQFIKNPARRVALPSHARPLHSELLAKQAAMEEALESAPWNRLALRGNVGIIASGIAGMYAEGSYLRAGRRPLIPLPGNLSRAQKIDLPTCWSTSPG